MMPRMARPDDITLIPLDEAHLDEVLAIEKASYPRPWRREHFLEELLSPHAFPLVAVDSNGRVAGYIFPVLILDEGEIRNVAVLTDARGCGVGKLLVTAVIDECRKRGARFLGLEVRVSNDAALALYRRLGFVENGRRANYYENGEEAILMKFSFRQSGE